MRIRNLVFAIAGAALLGGCGTTASGLVMDAIVRNVPYDIAFTLNPANPQAGDEVTVQWTVTRDGKLVDVYSVGNETMRVSLASENLSDFAHYYAEIQAEQPGQYSLKHRFTQSGRYHLWLEIPDRTTSDHHGDKADYIGFLDINIDGEQMTGAADTVMQSGTGAFQIDLVLPEDFQAEELQTLSFYLPNGKKEGVEFFPDIDHFYVLIAPEFREYRLRHTNHQIDSEQHLSTELTAFRKPGKYLLWSELYVRKDGEGRAVYPTFVFEVPEGPQAQ